MGLCRTLDAALQQAGHRPQRGQPQRQLATEASQAAGCELLVCPSVALPLPPGHLWAQLCLPGGQRGREVAGVALERGTEQVGAADRQ
jgi:hypothetical protein